MDVLFVDVGFGTCNLILTGGGEAIVIDAGKRAKVPLTVLNHFSVTRISHLIVSHWHDDHFGGATGLLRQYSGKIGKVWFPPDPAFMKTTFWKALDSEWKAGVFKDEQIKPLVIEGSGTRPIWISKVHESSLELVSPSFMESSKAGATRDSNATCGVLILRVGTRSVVFAGDASLAQWQEVHKRTTVPIEADALAVSHHAGIIWPSDWSAAEIEKALDNLYKKIVKPTTAIISAGTRPGTKHPREDVIAALRKARACVMCTQMTERCTSGLEAARTLRKSLPVIVPGRSSQLPIKTTKKKKSNHVACAGSVVVELLATGATIQQQAQHQGFVAAIPNKVGRKPICHR